MTDLLDELPRPGVPDRPPRLARLGRRLRSALPFVAGALAAFLAVAVYFALEPPPAPLTQRDVADTVAHALASATPAPPPSLIAYARVQPSLVLIQTDNQAGSPTDGSLGSGVVVDDSGHILTSLHVVSKATAIHVTFADGSRSDATVAESRPETDIAVLQPDSPPAGLQPAVLGNPGAVRVGSEVFAVGNPFGLYGSMSAGVVSGLDRSFTDPASNTVLHGLIQVDAAVNPGNSGGPLLDRDGRVIGIVAALLNPTKEDVFVGIGLAVPIDVAAGGAGGLPPY